MKEEEEEDLNDREVDDEDEEGELIVFHVNWVHVLKPLFLRLFQCHGL